MIKISSTDWEIDNIEAVLFDKDGTFIDLHFFWGKMTEMRAKENKELRGEEAAEKKRKSSIIINDGNEDKEEKENDKKIKISSIEELKNVQIKDCNAPEKKDDVSAPKVVDNTNKSYQLPPLTLLDKPKKKANETDNTIIEKNIEIFNFESKTKNQISVPC